MYQKFDTTFVIPEYPKIQNIGDCFGTAEINLKISNLLKPCYPEREVGPVSHLPALPSLCSCTISGAYKLRYKSIVEEKALVNNG